MRTEQFVAVVEAVPALPTAADQNLCFQRRTGRRGHIHLMRRVAVGRAEDRADACRVEAVFKIMFLQLIGRGDRNGAQLVQAENRKPELIMAFEHEHDAVAAPDAERFEIVRTLRRMRASCP